MGFWFKNWYFPSSACCRQLSVSHRYLAAFTMVQRHLTSEAQLNQFRFTTQKFSMSLVVNFNNLKQYNSQLVTFLQIRDIVVGLQPQSQPNFFLLQLPVLLFLSLLLQIAIQLSNLITKYYRQCSNFVVILKFPLAQLYLRGSELIITGWTFMHEVNILSPPSLARPF